MNEQTMQSTQQQEEMSFHIGTDGKRYPDPTPANYPWFGLEHLQYIQKYQPEFYQEMVTAGELNKYLNDVEMHAQQELDQIMQSMAKQDGTDEELKARDLQKWIGLMNNYRHCAAESVRKDWVYS